MVHEQALNNLWDCLISINNPIQDKGQLMLTIGVILNDLEKVRYAMENFDINPTANLTNRVINILTQFGVEFPNRPASPKGIDMTIN